MKRNSVLKGVSGILAVGAVLTSFPVTANAATTHTQYAPTVLSFNGQTESQPEHVIAPDPWSGSSTSWLPVWYLYHSLAPMGVSATWDGQHRILTFQVPSSVKVDTSNLPRINWTGKSGEMLIQFNAGGSVYSVMTCPYLAAPDPADNIETSYTPEYYVMLALKRLGITSNWNGTDWAMTTGSTTVTPPSSGNMETKLDAAVQMAQILGSDSGKGWVAQSQPIMYSDVPSADSSAIAAVTQTWMTAGQTIPAMFSPDSASTFGAGDGVTAEQVDAAYAAWLGTPVADNSFLPSGGVLGLGNVTTLNANVPTTGDLTTAQFATMMQNLKTIQTGFQALGNNQYKLVYRPTQGSFGNDGIPSNVEAQDAAQAIQYINSIVFTVNGSDETASLPGVSDSVNWSEGNYPVISAWSSTNQYSLNNGSTWLTSPGNDGFTGYSSLYAVDGGTGNPPSKVLIRGSATYGIQTTVRFLYNGHVYGFISDGAGIHNGSFQTVTS